MCRPCQATKEQWGISYSFIQRLTVGSDIRHRKSWTVSMKIGNHGLLRI
jgi:hypothetical protein